MLIGLQISLAPYTHKAPIKKRQKQTVTRQKLYFLNSIKLKIMLQVKKVYKTTDNTILIVKAELQVIGKQKPYVAVTADEIQPILRSEAVDRVREDLEEGELWRMAVEAKNTELGLSDWVEYVIDNDCELSGFDNSLYDAELTIDGEDYIFESRSCGCLHEDINAVTDEFKTLISLHLNSDKASITKAEKELFKLQKTEDRDIDFLVEKYTREIIEENN